MKDAFGFETALNELRSGKPLNGKDGVLTPLIKQLTEAALQAELEQLHINTHQDHLITSMEITQ